MQAKAQFQNRTLTFFSGKNRDVSSNNRWLVYCPKSLLIWATAHTFPFTPKKIPTVDIEAKKQTTAPMRKWNLPQVTRNLQQSKSISIKPAETLVGASPVNITWKSPFIWRKNNFATNFSLQSRRWFCGKSPNEWGENAITQLVKYCSH